MPTGFPFHYGCKANVNSVPFMFSDFTSSTSNGVVTYCTKVESHAVTSQNGCADMDFNKLELLVTPSCHDEIAGLSVNGEPKAASYQYYMGGKYMTVKFTQLNDREFRNTPAIGSTMCISVKEGRCSELPTLTMGSSFQAAIFNKENRCCPSYSVPY